MSTGATGPALTPAQIIARIRELLTGAPGFRATPDGTNTFCEVTGLNGDADGDYDVFGIAKLTSNGAGNAVDAMLAPEALTTNQSSEVSYFGGGALAAQVTTANLRIGNYLDVAGGTNSDFYFRGFLRSKTSDGSRLWRCDTYRLDTTGNKFDIRTTGLWAAATPITKLRLLCDVAGKLAAGSFLIVKPLGTIA